MKHGVVFPQTEFGNDVQAIKDYAQTAEGLGYDYLLVYDHVLGAHPSREPKLTGPYTYEHPFHEPMVFFGFLSAITPSSSSSPASSSCRSARPRSWPSRPPRSTS